MVVDYAQDRVSKKGAWLEPTAVGRMQELSKSAACPGAAMSSMAETNSTLQSWM